MIVKLLVEGGNMQPGPAVAQKLGPMGINMGKVISSVNEATGEFKGLKVPIELDVDPTTKDFQISVSSPPVSELVKKELGIEKGSGEHNKLKAGNLSIEEVIKVAKIKKEHMLDTDLKKSVKSVLGACVSLGILVENENPKKVTEQVISGKYDKEIKEEKTEPDEEKKKKLEEYFAEIKNKQDEILRKEQEEKEAEEAKAASTGEKQATESKESEKEKK